jgi:S-DNA-T family DNA segregation ATPase FtsK/SpoIIIE
MEDRLAREMSKLVIDLNALTTNYETTVAGLQKELADTVNAAQGQLEQATLSFKARKENLGLARTATADQAKFLLAQGQGYQASALNHLRQQSVYSNKHFIRASSSDSNRNGFAEAERCVNRAKDRLSELTKLQKPSGDSHGAVFGGLCVPGFVISICAAANASTGNGFATFVLVNGLFLGLAIAIAITRTVSASSQMKSEYQDIVQNIADAQAYLDGAAEYADEELARETKLAEHSFKQAQQNRWATEKTAGSRFETEMHAFMSRFVPVANQLKEEFARFDLATGFVGMKWGAGFLWNQWEPATVPALCARLGMLKSRRIEVLKPYFEDSLLDFSIPALFPIAKENEGRSLLLKCAGEAKERAARSVQSMIMRFLTTMPPGKVKFTLIDPVGLGQNASAFMQLGDYDESLVSGKAWTEPQHIEEQLLELTEHMETVIQKYLRNDFDSIEQYNQSAGEVAEAYRVLVVWDFPVNFNDTAARRLVSIAENGPRCGVFTVVLMDTSAEKRLPYGFTPADLERVSNVIAYDSGRFVWLNDHCKEHELVLDEPPGAELAKHVIANIGLLAKSALNVQVPYGKLLGRAQLGDGNWWQKKTEHLIESPLGPHGANKIQSLRLGEKTAHHAIIVGRTGSGKSNLMHVIITSLALSYPPDEIELYLIDFKQGVEFKPYALAKLPHAKVIAIESEREFGISVLQGLNAELHRRGELFRTNNVSNIADYRRSVGPLPRILLLVDEFQEFFSQDDAISSQARIVFDRLVRQGRSQGIHIMLGSQTLQGASDLPHSIISQMGVRIALQCTEADARQIMGDQNLVNRQLTRPGEAIYNPESGQVEANKLFQVALFTEQDRDLYLGKIAELAMNSTKTFAAPIIFEGNEPASIESCLSLQEVAEAEYQAVTSKSILAWLGEPIAIRPPVAAKFRRQGCSNLLVVSRDEQQGVGAVLASLLSLFAQCAPERTEFFILNLTTADSEWNEIPQLIKDLFPHKIELVKRAGLNALLQRLVTQAEKRASEEKTGYSEIFVMLLGLHRIRDLRDDFDGLSSLYKSESDSGLDGRTLFAKLMREGPESGIHVIAWCDAYSNLARIDRRLVGEFAMRVAGPMSNDDSQHLIDDALGSKLDRPHRAVFFDEDQPGQLEKFRPYAVPETGWLKSFAKQLQTKYVKSQGTSGG